MDLKPHQHVRLQKSQALEKYDAVVLQAGQDRCTVSLYEAPPGVFSPGEHLEMEFARWEDGLYVVQARVEQIQEVPAESPSENAAEVSLETPEEARSVTCRLEIQITGSGLVQRRRSERMTVNIPAEYTPLQEKPLDQEMPKGLILNISHTGALLSVEHPLEVGSELLLMFEVSLNRDKVPIGTTGQVVREHEKGSRPGVSYCYGVQFQKPQGILAS